MSAIARLVFLGLLLANAAGFAQDYVPEALQDWQRWVLKDKEYRDCPFYFDRNAAGPQDFVCAWPGLLQLSVNKSSAEFLQTWTVYAERQWLALPGSVEYWPAGVAVNGRGIEVVARDNVPSVQLAPGSYEITGRITWDERPGSLRLPPQSGLLTLNVDGRTIERPGISRGAVFLGEQKRDTRVVDSVTPRVYRLVADDVPTMLITQLQIDISGSVREEVFGPILPAGFVPLRLQSPLPARLEADGNLRLQVRPGRWTIFLHARAPGALDTIAWQGGGRNLPAAEIWSYQSNDRLRVSAAEGLPPVDPRQVQVPAGWESLPAFRVEPGANFVITERSRGVTSASNELSLDRTMWLDFDGKGLVARDTVSGQMQSDWRLDMLPPFSLLSATEYGENLLVTRGQGDSASGVELRHTRVDLKTIARSDGHRSIPVTGWDARFARVTATLNLPPGNRLLAAPGVDVARGSWVSQWQLLDFFLVLIITIAAWRLLGRGAGLIALFALVLSFQEMHAPGWLWLNMLIAIALLRVAPPGRLRQAVSVYRLLAAAALVLALVPFLADQLRLAIYPQLEPQYNEYQLYDYGVVPMPAAADVPLLEKQEAVRRQAEVLSDESRGLKMSMAASPKTSVAFARYAPNAIVQAGPGIPSWRWNTHSLSWSGPVDAEQNMRLVVLPRWMVSVLRVAAVLLLLLFAAALAREAFKNGWSSLASWKPAAGPAAATLLATMLCITLAASPPAQAQIPDADLLRQLEQRLLEPPDCVPRCAEIVSADVGIDAQSISMRLVVHALEDVAIPLPGSADGWRPQAILIDGAANTRVLRAPDDSLWLNLAAGSHGVTLRGDIPSVDTLEVAFPTPPRVVKVDSNGWLVSGIKDSRLLSGSLQLARSGNDVGGADTTRWESSRFPAFARVERMLELDLDWRVRTTVYRVAPAEGALTLSVPLLDGEKIVSGDFTVAEGRVLVSMDPRQQAVSWTSDLPRKSPLTLVSEAGASWSDVWRFAIGNIWNAHFDGVPESDTKDDVNEVRIAEFHPRSGEQLTMVATRPEASKGSTLAFDAVNISVSHGNRSSDVSLMLNYRSTRGAQHDVRLPDGAEVSAVAIDGRSQSVRAEDGVLTLPILPGEHAIQINWRQSGAMTLRTTTPTVNLAAPASNIEMSLTKPRERWLLATSGPQLGPAVLYWSELALLLVFAWLLGRVHLTPLAGRHWLLLGLGFSTFSWPALAVIVVWLFACGMRERWQIDVNWWRFNVIQVGIAALTLIALSLVVTTLPQGLLGTPDMQVTGHGSNGDVLRWFADKSDSELPIASLVTVPLWIYKALILAWALWLSFALLRWLPWVWRCFSSQGYWRSKQHEALSSTGEGQ